MTPQATARRPARRGEALSRERIIEAAVAMLDSVGEDGLTFRGLSERLATGAGAIYWHIDNKHDLLTAACDAIVVRTLAAVPAGETPRATLRMLALGMFDAMDAHPWIGSALIGAPGELPVVRILEGIGRQVRALEVAVPAQWTTASALLHYILGVGALNAANGQRARAHGTDRGEFLDTLAARWSQLDAEAFAFTRGIAAQMRTHEDRADFLAGVDLLLAGIPP